MRTDRRLIYLGLFLLDVRRRPARRPPGLDPGERRRGALAALAGPADRHRPVDHPGRPPRRLAGRRRRRGLPRGDGRARSSRPASSRSSAAAVTRPASPFQAQSGELASRTQRRHRRSAAASSTSTTGPGADWSVEGSSEDGRAPTSGPPTTASSSSRRARSVFGFGGGRENWTVTLPTEPTIGPRRDAQRRLRPDRPRRRQPDRRRPDRQRGFAVARPPGRRPAIERLDGTVNAGSSVTWLPELPLAGRADGQRRVARHLRPGRPRAADRDRRQPDLVERLRTGRPRPDRRRVGDAGLRLRRGPDRARRHGECRQHLPEPGRTVRPLSDGDLTFVTENIQLLAFAATGLIAGLFLLRPGHASLSGRIADRRHVGVPDLPRWPSARRWSPAPSCRRS